MTLDTRQAITIRLDIVAPPPVPAGWKVTAVEATKKPPYARNEWWGVSEHMPLDSCLRRAFEWAAEEVGVENVRVDVVLERDDQEGRLVYRGDRDAWRTEVE